MNLDELRRVALEWLDNPSGDVWVDGNDYRRLDNIINEAYRSLVREVFDGAQNWNLNLEAEVVVISVTPTAKEYAVLITGEAVSTQTVRKIVDITRTEGVNPIKINVVPFGERYRAETRNTVYVYRHPSGMWMLGFTVDEPEVQTLEVRTESYVPDLVNAADYPMALPTDWHSLIAIDAAVLGKVQTGRDFAPLALYSAGQRRLLVDDTAKVTSGSQSQRF